MTTTWLDGPAATRGWLVRGLAAIAVAFAILLVVASPAAAAAPSTFAQPVIAELSEHTLRLKLRSTLREPVIATDASPIMAPYFSKKELEDVAAKYGPYVLAHVHLLARSKPVTGVVVSSRLVEPIDAPLHRDRDLDGRHAEVELAYQLDSDEPLSLSFDLLTDKEAAPGVPAVVVYSLDLRGRRNRHADLATGASYTIDVVDPTGASSRGPRAEGGPAQRPRRGNASLLGLVIFVGILGIGYMFVSRMMKARRP